MPNESNDVDMDKIDMPQSLISKSSSVPPYRSQQLVATALVEMVLLLRHPWPSIGTPRRRLEAATLSVPTCLQDRRCLPEIPADLRDPRAPSAEEAGEGSPRSHLRRFIRPPVFQLLHAQQWVKINNNINIDQAETLLEFKRWRDNSLICSTRPGKRNEGRTHSCSIRPGTIPETWINTWPNQAVLDQEREMNAQSCSTRHGKRNECLTQWCRSRPDGPWQ